MESFAKRSNLKVQSISLKDNKKTEKKVAMKFFKRVDLSIEKIQIASCRGVLSKIKLKVEVLSWQGFLNDQTLPYNWLWYIMIK